MSENLAQVRPTLLTCRYEEEEEEEEEGEEDRTTCLRTACQKRENENIYIASLRLGGRFAPPRLN